MRHPAYKELIEPEEKTCSSYLNPKRKEFWRTDAAVVLKREMKAEKDRCKVNLSTSFASPMLQDIKTSSDGISLVFASRGHWSTWATRRGFAGASF